MNPQQSVTFNMSGDDQVAGAKLSALRVFRPPFGATTIIAMVFVLGIVGATIIEQVKTGELSAQPLLPLAGLFGLGLLLILSPPLLLRAETSGTTNCFTTPSLSDGMSADWSTAAMRTGRSSSGATSIGSWKTARCYCSSFHLHLCSSSRRGS